MKNLLFCLFAISMQFMAAQNVCEKVANDTEVMRELHHKILRKYATNTAFTTYFKTAHSEWNNYRDSHKNAVYPQINATTNICRCALEQELINERIAFLNALDSLGFVCLDVVDDMCAMLPYMYKQNNGMKGINVLYSNILADYSRNTNFSSVFPQSHRDWQSYKNATISALTVLHKDGIMSEKCKCAFEAMLVEKRLEQMGKWTEGVVEKGDVCVGTYKLSTQSPQDKKRILDSINLANKQQYEDSVIAAKAALESEIYANSLGSKVNENAKITRFISNHTFVAKGKCKYSMLEFGDNEELTFTKYGEDYEYSGFWHLDYNQDGVYLGLIFGRNAPINVKISLDEDVLYLIGIDGKDSSCEYKLLHSQRNSADSDPNDKGAK